MNGLSRAGQTELVDRIEAARTPEELRNSVSNQEIDSMTSPGSTRFDKRWDLVPGKGVFADWIATNDMTALIAGSTGLPPMMSGVKAFNGPVCPW